MSVVRQHRGLLHLLAACALAGAAPSGATPMQAQTAEATPILSLAGGLRADLSSQWGARLELDTRAFGGFKAGAVGWSIGVARQF